MSEQRSSGFVLGCWIAFFVWLVVAVMAVLGLITEQFWAFLVAIVFAVVAIPYTISVARLDRLR